MNRFKYLVRSVGDACLCDRTKKPAEKDGPAEDDDVQHPGAAPHPTSVTPRPRPAPYPDPRPQGPNSRTPSPTSENWKVPQHACIGPGNNRGGVDEWLEDELRKNRIETETSVGSHLYFVPWQALETLISVSVVSNCILRRYKSVEPNEAQECAEETCKSARSLFATLAIMGKGGEIYDFLQEGVSDKDLPLKRGSAKRKPFSLRRRRTKQEIGTMKNWTGSELQKFDRRQLWMTAPVFKHMEHNELNDNTILPFIPFERGEKIPETEQGGYSKVSPVRIHPAHHNFWNKPGQKNDTPLVAIKKLISPKDKDFEKERDILRALGVKQNQGGHLIKLLATYRQRGEYHLIFHYAGANLKSYWEEKHPEPNFEKIALWTVKQMAGIARALTLIHNFAPSDPPVTSKTGTRMWNGKPGLPPGEGVYGRHGDIKPENILWFQTIPGADYGENGILQLADLGLGRFHGRDSRSNEKGENVVGSPTYKPPECKPGKLVSRSYDIWCLGGMYLEFITWALMGGEAVGLFSEEREDRSDPRDPPELTDDHFYTTIAPSNPLDSFKAEVRLGVLDWVNKLHQHEKCSVLIHELLNLIMKKLLVVDRQARIPANKLCQELDKLVKRSEEDPDYLLRPWPSDSDLELLDWPPQSAISTSEIQALVSVNGRPRVTQC